MQKYITLLLFVMISISVVAQNVVVSGVAEGQKGKLVRVIVYSDQFSTVEKTLAETRTNDDGEFLLKFWINKTQFAFFAFELEKGEFYISPGSTYKFKVFIDSLSGDASIFDRLPLRFTLDADDAGVQQSIGNYNVAYNNFLYNNINAIYKSRDKTVVTNFISEMRNNYINNNSEYVNNYVDYSLASLQWLSGKENNTQILEKYIINKPVLYNNIQYTSFFKEFFKNFDFEKAYTHSELILAINNPNFDVLTNLLMRNKQIAADTRVFEIVEMLLLSRNYYNRDVEKKQVILKLNNISNTSNYIENKLIANNYITELQAMQNGSRAPDFTLIDINNDTVSLDSFKGKFILLSFTKDNCKICNFHMQKLNDIKKQLSDKFEIVTVVAGDNMSGIVEYAKGKGFTWPILKSGDNILVFEDYDIVAYPSYIFINPDGTVAYAHMPMPEENMEVYIKRFMEGYINTN